MLAVGVVNGGYIAHAWPWSSCLPTENKLGSCCNSANTSSWSVVILPVFVTQTCLLPTMPKPHEWARPKQFPSRHGRRSVQVLVHCSMRQSTCASTRSSSNTGTTPQHEMLTYTVQPDSLAGQSLSDLLSLVIEQVQAEVQAQQA